MPQANVLHFKARTEKTISTKLELLCCSPRNCTMCMQVPVSLCRVHIMHDSGCRIMREYMPKVGTLGHDMMFRSTTIQVSNRKQCPALPLSVHLALSPALPHLAPAQLCPAMSILPCPSLPLLSLALAWPSPVSCPCCPALFPAVLFCCPVLPCLRVSCLAGPLPSGAVLLCLCLPCPVGLCPHHAPIATVHKSLRAVTLSKAHHVYPCYDI